MELPAPISDRQTPIHPAALPRISEIWHHLHVQWDYEKAPPPSAVVLMAGGFDPHFHDPLTGEGIRPATAAARNLASLISCATAHEAVSLLDCDWLAVQAHVGSSALQIGDDRNAQVEIREHRDPHLVDVKGPFCGE